MGRNGEKCPSEGSEVPDELNETSFWKLGNRVTRDYIELTSIVKRS